MSLKPLYTIGYARFPLSLFLEIIKKFAIASVFDIRSVPFSARFRCFNRDRLKISLERADVEYIWLGDRLGGLKGGGFVPIASEADLASKRRDESFVTGCDEVYHHLEKAPACLMCAENDPVNCHRAILVAHLFRQLYPEVEIRHIWKPKNADEEILETQQNLDERIVGKFSKNCGWPVPEHTLECAYAANNARYYNKKRRKAFPA